MKQFFNTIQGMSTVVFLAVLILLGGVYQYQQSKIVGSPRSETTLPTPSRMLVSSSTPVASATPKRSSASSSTMKEAPAQVTRYGSEGLTYGEAINRYTTSRIQLNNSCQAVPSQLVLKKGGKFMIDNRASVARSIAIAGKTYSLEAYGFSVFSLNDSSLPHTAYLDCGSSKNVAKFLIQG